MAIALKFPHFIINASHIESLREKAPKGKVEDISETNSSGAACCLLKPNFQNHSLPEISETMQYALSGTVINNMCPALEETCSH